MAIDYSVIGQRIKQARKSINYTQEKLAFKLNTTHSVISAYESGKTAVPTLFVCIYLISLYMYLSILNHFLPTLSSLFHISTSNTYISTG